MNEAQIAAAITNPTVKAHFEKEFFAKKAKLNNAYNEAVKQAVADAKKTEAEKLHKEKRKVKEPENFTGNKKKTNEFIQKVKWYLKSKKSLYPDDESKILYVKMLLSDDAFTWVTNKEQKDKIPMSFEEFLKQIH